MTAKKKKAKKRRLLHRQALPGGGSIQIHDDDSTYVPLPLSKKDQLLLNLRVERDAARAQLQGLAGRLVAHGLHGQRTWDPVMVGVIDAALRKVAAQKDAVAHAAEVERKTTERLVGIEKLLSRLCARTEREGGVAVEKLLRRLMRDEDD